MKPLDIEAAKAGESVVTRDGRRVKFIAYVPEAKYPVVAMIEGENAVRTFTVNGEFLPGSSTWRDLFMAPKKSVV